MHLRTRSVSGKLSPILQFWGLKDFDGSLTMFCYDVRKSIYLFARLLYIFNRFLSGSKLHAMFSGESDPKPSEDRSYFLDRDGTHFRYILNYLRTGQLIVPKDEIIREELLAEAEFYQIKEIINEIKWPKARALKDSWRLSSEPGVSNRWVRNRSGWSLRSF